MADVLPFRGLRYNPALVPDLTAAISPPYDVISPEEQQWYYRRHPYNVIRLELGETLADDGPEQNRYTRARAYLEKWLEERVLVPDAAPGFYLCQDEFSWQGRTVRRLGLIAALRAVPYSRGTVLPHEDTLPKAKGDRYELLLACRTNFSPIFVLYRDPAGEVTARLRPYLEGPALAQASTREGVTHRLWSVDEPETVAAISRLFTDRLVYIADGHHRYETACRFAEEHGERYGFVLATLVALEDPGLIVLPTHRLLRDLDPPRWSLLPGGFERRSYTYAGLSEDPGQLEGFLRLLAEAGRGNYSFGFYQGGDTLELVYDPGRTRENRPAPGTLPLLDVTVLHQEILLPVFNLHPDQVAHGRCVAYTRDPVEAWKAVRDGDCQTAVFLNPPTLEQITAVAAAGGRMPQKSTYFWPKLPAGLVMLRLEGVGE
ncbi:MAG: DUF1015 domain-containing protein [Clostridia bacterium]|nr:DUF1015 domain-containing protein [Clostridia bacterium]MDH7572409.1 DUF1015 domain-containing protein [Clostridia bacterium]